MFNIKKLLSGAAVMAALLMISSVAAKAEKVDFSFRNAIYLVTKQDSKINTNRKYAFPGTKMTVSASDAVSCTDDGCIFRLGVYVFRKNTSSPTTVDVSELNESGPFKGNMTSIKFAGFSDTTELIFTIKVLYTESNTIMMRVDPDDHFDEADEHNNAFESSISLIKPIVIKRGSESGGNPRQVVITRDDIGNAFKNVYGYPPDAERTDYWLARKADYETIVAEESKRQNAEPTARKLMISRVYKDTFGRVANKKEMDYWLPKLEYYKQIFEANRTYLYSPGGSQDLVETVKRFLTGKNGKAPDDPQLTATIKNYRQLKPVPIFDEMK